MFLTKASIQFGAPGWSVSEPTLTWIFFNGALKLERKRHKFQRSLHIILHFVCAAAASPDCS